MLKITDDAFSPGEFTEIEEDIRRFSGELEFELEQKSRECLLTREQARLRLSEIEAETLRRVEAEWQEKEQKLALLEAELEKEVALFREEASKRIMEETDLASLLEDVFSAVLGEKEP